MARLWSSGFELGSAGDLTEFSTGASISSTTVRSGTYACRIVPNTTLPVVPGYSFAASAGTGPYYARGYIYVVTLPTANNMVFSFYNSTVGNRAGIELTSTGTFQLRDEDGTVGSESASISLNTWQCIEVMIDRTPAAGSHVVAARLNQTEFASSSTRNIGTGVDRLRFGFNLRNEAQSQAEWFFDDFAINDSTGSVQNSWPGSGKIIHLRPDSAGDNTTWTPSTGSNFQNVDEVTPDNDTTYNHNNGTTTSSADDFNVDASGLSASDTVNLVQVGYRARGETSTSNQYEFVMRVKKTSSATVGESASINLASTSHTTNGPAPNTYKLTAYTDPDGAAWTNSTLDSMQIGYRTSVVATNRVRISTVWALVEYVPAEGGGGTPEVDKAMFFGTNF